MMIRHGEGTSDGLGYSRMFGGAQFDSFTDHPRTAQTYKMGKTGKTLTSTAAGAYQFPSRTWDGLVKQYGFTDFTPESQDLGAIALIRTRRPAGCDCRQLRSGCVRAIRNGPACQVAPTDSRSCVWITPKRHTSTQAGSSSISQHNPEGDYCEPFIVPAISAVIDLLPKPGTIFGSGSDVSNRNIKAVEMVIDTAKEAIGARNEQELAEAIKSDPAAAASVKAAVEAKWFELTEVGGGVESARKANAEMTEKVLVESGHMGNGGDSPSGLPRCLCRPDARWLV